MTSGHGGPGWSSPGAITPPASTATPQVPAGQPVPPAWHVPSQPGGYGQPQSSYPQQTHPQPGYPHGYAWPAPPARPPVKHSPIRWVVVVVCVLVICVFGAVGAIVGIGDLAGIERQTISWRPAELPIDAPPAVNAPASVWNAWARQAVDTSVRNQAAALVAGDETRYLAPADPENTGLVADLQRRYRTLREMGVGQWSQTIRTTPKVIGELSWSADIKLSYCFGDPSCRLNNVVLGSEWRLRNDHLLMTDLAVTEADQYGPRPWEKADLSIGRGSRVVVATTQQYSGRLADTVAMADRAAKVADSLAKWNPPPSQYVAFIAGRSEWSTWYSLEQPEWAGGVYIHQTDNEVVINGPYTLMEHMEALLTHEFTHVATMAGAREGASNSAWWLIEGTADYATMIGKPVSKYDPDSLSAVRSYVNGGWDGDPAMEYPGDGATLEEATASYGIAFLAVRRIADVYGQDRMLDFFGKIVHDDQTAEAASTQALGKTWSTVKADCAQFIRNSV